MKGLLTLLFLLFIQLSFSQKQSLNFSYIDHKVRSIEACAPDSLSLKLTSSYVTDLEKLRSIFRWVTENIAYRTKTNHNYFKKNRTYVYEDIEDTNAEYTSLNERIALQVLKQKEAVCDGYARLLKVLCDYAGLRCEIITGYARTDINKMGAQFKSNHRWNAVLLDSAWYLLDATWASGHIAYNNDEFIKAYDDRYFLTPPEQFIRDHYPEDADSKEIDFLFSINNKSEGKCFDDVSTINFIYEGKQKANFRNTGTMNCEGLFHVTFKNVATTPAPLQKLATKKLTGISLTGSNKTITVVSLGPAQQQQLMDMIACIVKEGKTLVK